MAIMNQEHGERRLVPLDRGDRRRRVLHSRGDRDGNRQHVVDEQRRRHRQAVGRAEVDRGHLVVSAAARVGVHVLAVGGDDGQHHEDDDQADLPAERVGGQSGQRQGQEDLVRGVRDRRERVAGEDRQGDALGQQRLAELVAAQCPADDEPLEDVVHFSHVPRG